MAVYLVISFLLGTLVGATLGILAMAVLQMTRDPRPPH
jgi:NhaP-type Na+/H+ or K+/H+ antiporter